VNARPLARIEADLAAAFQRESRGAIEIGGLLIEAKEQLDAHGQWLPWLKDKFPHAIRTAQNYMAAHRLAGEYATVAHLKLSTGGLYALVAADNAGDVSVIDKVLQEAKTKWVDADRVREIAEELRPPPDPLPPSTGEDPAEKPDADADDANDDDDDDDDGDDETPPDDERPPPPSPGLNPKQARLVRDFDDAVAAFKNLVTRRAADFAPAATPTFDLEMIGNFLLQVARERSRASSEIARAAITG
jgi:Protein of unknown function (DUF3102)